MNDWDDTLGYASATRNDFVMMDDPQGAFDVSEGFVAEVAKRAGTDGFIRALRTSALPPTERERLAGAGDGAPEWFMDYRNADGSLASMCGNGVRAFAAYLRDKGYVQGDSFNVLTRAGVRRVSILHDGPQWQVRVGMGPAVIDGTRRMVHIAGRALEGVDVNVGNPHTVVQLPEEVSLEDLDLETMPGLDPVPTDGTNIEFVEPRGERHVAMRVFERGVGETLSCGTGATAVAAATSLQAGDQSREPWRVDVRGGTLWIGWDGEEMTLTGPAELSGAGRVRSLTPVEPGRL